MNAKSEKFLAEIRDKNADVRYRAWSHAGEMDAEVIPELAKLLEDGEPGVRRAAEEALKTMVHAVGKDRTAPKRRAVVMQLIGLTADGTPEWTRTIALRHLSLIGGVETVPAAARLLFNTDLQEEAVFCLERIPGNAATEALLEALPEVNTSFAPRVLAALGHRRAEDATDLCRRSMTATNAELAVAGMKALARIGQKPAGGPKWPDESKLTGWLKVEWADSVLRYADEQARRGNVKDAVDLYKQMLERTEEHLQCAAIVGLSKTNAPEAGEMIAAKTKSENRTVRITAEKARAARKG